MQLLHLLRKVLKEVLLLLLDLRHAPSSQCLLFSRQRQVLRLVAPLRLLDQRVFLLDDVQELDAIFGGAGRNAFLLILLEVRLQDPLLLFFLHLLHFVLLGSLLCLLSQDLLLDSL